MTEATPAEDTGSERHASWVELFFDLVVVAGVTQLTHLLHDGESASSIALYALLFLAFWTAWGSITMYGNIAGERTHLSVVLVAMFGLAVMMASVAQLDEHWKAFAVGYILVRVLASRVWRRTQIVVDWPAAQLFGGVMPWIVSLWVSAEVRPWLWALGVAIDLFGLLMAQESRMMASAQERLDRVVERVQRSGRQFPEAYLPSLQAVRSDPVHLGERLGLFVIIVLGEGVIQVIAAASGVEWDRALGLWAVGSFAVLVGLWALSLIYGYAGVPLLRINVLPVRIAMAFHCVTTCALAGLAAGLGIVAAHPHSEPPATVRWLLYGGAALYFLTSLIAGVLTKARLSWLLAFALPCVLAPVVLASLGSLVGIAWSIWVLAAAVVWQLIYVRRIAPAPSPA
ncbi:low temperature requirement protein A [Tenggerimyces flavus]|uniref:Low temperature requirement protein A n=1 Tax=Tenggerimyces flavus TaxID=1708749 RepID=A0ABV7YKY3_9ACTN|nr:low temperature requirement protein A [Tenggerimyces flavus]MBM7787286.1 low temperature requirement protein LtrA [Tenggerimyces flavus]